MSVLQLDPTTGYLAAGSHWAHLDDVDRVFGIGPLRVALMKGLREVVTRLERKGVERIWVDGSFVSTKVRPRDVDVVYEPPSDADTATWGILAFARRKELKQMYRVDLWPHPSPQPARRGDGTVPLVDWFRHDRDGNEKGIVELVLPDTDEVSP